MKIEYKNKHIEKICTDASEAIRKYGIILTQKLRQRLNEICAAENVELMIRFKIGHCHKLTGDRKEQYSVYLTHPYRLVFTVKDDIVQIATINEIIDYH